MNRDFVLQLLKPYRKNLAALGLLQLLRGAAAVLAAAATAWLLDGFFLRQLAIEKAVPWFVVLLFAVVLRSLVQLPVLRITGAVSLSVQEGFRRRLHEAIGRRSPLDPSLASSGRLLSLALESVDGLDDFFRHFLPQALEAVLLLPFFLLVTLWVEPATALVFLVTAPIGPFLLYLIGRLTREKSQRQWQQLQKLSSHFAELLRGLPMLKLFNRSQAQEACVLQDSQAFSQASLQVLQLAFVSAFALELITTLSIALIAVSIGLRLLAGQLSFFTAFFALLLAPEFYQPLRQSGAAFHAGIQAHTAASSLLDFLAPEEHRSPAVQNSLQQLRIPPDIRFCQVHCGYPGRQDTVLRGLSFYAPAGKITLLTGTSGAGKSTVLALLLKQLQPAAGEIQVSSLPFQRFSPAEWPCHLAYVPQEPHIFQASLRENIILSPEPSLDDRQAESALRAAGLASWYQRLPQGMDTLLGDGFRSMSCGQRRRLGIARALYRQTSLLLLDEITAGLDAASEQQILHTLRELRGDHTILMVAHRPALRKIADQIILLDGGKEVQE